MKRVKQIFVVAMFAATLAHADVYAKNSGDCVKSGYDREVLQTAGDHKGEYRCFCGAAPATAARCPILLPSPVPGPGGPIGPIGPILPGQPLPGPVLPPLGGPH